MAVRPAIRMQGESLLGRVSDSGGAAHEILLGTGLSFEDGRLVSSNVVERTGDPGPQGDTGPQGPPGEDGADGDGALPWQSFQRDFGATGDGSVQNDAMLAFLTYAQAQTEPVHLVIEPGEYTFTGSTATQVKGIKDLTISAYGAVIDELWFGGSHFDDNTHNALIETANRGEDTVTLVTLSDHSIFAVDDWVYIGALDLQGFGYPPNHQVFEYKQINAINTGTGVITLNGGLMNDYLSTWPHFESGGPFNIDVGGPAMIYKMPSNWDMRTTIRGAHITESITTGFRVSGRSVSLIDCLIDCEFWPSSAQTISLRNCYGFHGHEVDKAVECLRYQDCQSEAHMEFQSASVNQVILDNVDIGSASAVQGTGKNTVIRNSRIPYLKVGPSAYGVPETCLIENSTVGDLDISVITDPRSSFTVADGKIVRPMADGSPAWAVPGAMMSYGSNYNGPPFKVLSVAESGSDLVISTTINEPEVVPAGSSDNFTCYSHYNALRGVNSAGCAAIVDLCTATQAGYRYGEYFQRFYTGPGVSALGKYDLDADTFIEGFGYIVSVTIDIVRAYTGAQASCNFQIEPDWIYIIDETNTQQEFSPVVNCKVAGERVMTMAGPTGSQSGDTLVDLSVYDSAWVRHNAQAGQWRPCITANISADDPSQWPIIEFKVIMDHGRTSRGNWNSSHVWIN